MVVLWWTCNLCWLNSVTQSCPTLYNLLDGSPPGSLSMGFPRQEYWIGLPFPSPRDLLDPGIKAESPVFPALQAFFFFFFFLMLSKPAPYYTLTLKVISRVLAPHSQCKLSHSLPRLTSLRSHWTSVSSVSPVHLVCGLKSFWPPCSMPVLQITTCLASNYISTPH